MIAAHAALLGLASLLASAPRGDAGGAGDKVTVEGRISSVMEVYPPRLDLKVKEDRYTIYLAEETKVTRKGKKAGFGDLRENQTVEVVGVRREKDRPFHLNADEVKILEEAPK